MANPARDLYESLKSFKSLRDLIDAGETEGQMLECKSPQSPKLNKGLKAQLAEAVSAFANTTGGVIIWGMSTTHHAHSGADVLTQIEPIGNCDAFLQATKKAIPGLTTPPVLDCLSKPIRKSKKDTRGVVVTYIPPVVGDPVRTVDNPQFYYRSDDQCVVAPYDMVKRLFAATDIPDLEPYFGSELVSQMDDGSWRLPVGLANRASAVARDVTVYVQVENPDVTSKIVPSTFTDASPYNPGRRVFISYLPRPVHRGLSIYVGELQVTMQVQARAKRRLDLSVQVFADKMRAKRFSYVVTLAKKKFKVKKVSEGFVY